MAIKNLTLKIQGQGHGWGQSSKSHCESNILSTHIPLVPCQSALSFQINSIFKIWPWKSSGQGHSSRSQSRYKTLSTHIPFVPCRSALPFLRYRYFKIWPKKFMVKVMGEVKVQSHNMGPKFSPLTTLSFHVNWASHSRVMTFSKFDLENPGSRSWVRSKFKVTMWVQHPIDSHPFHSMSIGLPIPEMQHFQNLTLKIQGQGQMTMILQNYRSRQFHRTSNGINPSSGFKEMGSAKSGPSAAWFEKFLAHGHALMGQKGK